jgi:hypothetical protein
MIRQICRDGDQKVATDSSRCFDSCGYPEALSLLAAIVAGRIVTTL